MRRNPAEALMIQNVIDMLATKNRGSSTGRREKNSEMEKSRRPPTLSNCSSSEASWSITNVHCKGSRTTIYAKLLQRAVLSWNWLYPSARPIAIPMEVEICTNARCFVHSVATRRPVTICKRTNSKRIAAQSHQRECVDDFSMALSVQL